MPRMKFCRCGQIIPENETCPCKKEAQRAQNKRRREMAPEEKKFFNSKRWKILRISNINRDGAHCQRCLFKYNMIESRNLQAHHIKPRIKYNGTNGLPDLRYDPTNLLTLCKSCNTTIGTKEQLDFDWQFKDDVWEPVL